MNVYVRDVQLTAHVPLPTLSHGAPLCLAVPASDVHHQLLERVENFSQPPLVEHCT